MRKIERTKMRISTALAIAMVQEEIRHHFDSSYASQVFPVRWEAAAKTSTCCAGDEPTITDEERASIIANPTGVITLGRDFEIYGIIGPFDSNQGGPCGEHSSIGIFNATIRLYALDSNHPVWLPHVATIDVAIVDNPEAAHQPSTPWYTISRIYADGLVDRCFCQQHSNHPCSWFTEIQRSMIATKGTTSEV